jgi:hypothetical protein
MKRATAISAVLQVILAFACCNNGARSTLVEAKHGRIPQGQVFDRAEWLIRDVVIFWFRPTKTHQPEARE